MSHNYHLYRDGNPCPTCGRERTESVVHIGHSGGGWVFLWRGWREESPLGRPITTPTEWAAVLLEETTQGAVIKDDYGQQFTFDEFMARVARKREPRNGRPASLHSDLGGGSLDCVHTAEGDDIAFYEFS